eukprot:4540866-Karenia_brevis.AAC.1
MTPQVWARYANFLLGPKVYGLRMRTGDRQEEAAVHVPWTLLLSYELEIRKAACSLVNEEGLTLTKALENAMRDNFVRDIHFVSPLALTPSQLKRPAVEMAFGSPPGSVARTSASSNKGNGKGGKKGKKGKTNAKLQ